MILIIGAFLGLISVAFGAWAEHEFSQTLTQEHFSFLITAIRYNQLHAVIIAAIGLTLLNGGKLSNVPALKWSGWLFIIATVLFSLRIYLSAWLNIPSLVKITPLDGIGIMIAWIMLGVAGFLSREKQ